MAAAAAISVRFQPAAALHSARRGHGRFAVIRAQSAPAAAALTQDDLKRLAAVRAVEQVQSGMVLGLGTGSTAAFAVAEIGALVAAGKLSGIVGVPTSKRTFEQAQSLGIPLSTLDDHPRIDLAIDGADEVDPDLNLVKGRGGALLREKMVEAASDKFIVVVDETKLVTGAKGTRKYDESTHPRSQITREDDMAGGDEEATLLLPPPAGSEAAEEPTARPPPADRLGVGYLVFFILGAGFLLPWNAFITAVDYFSYLYPGAPVDRVFSVAYMLSCLLPLLLIVLCFPKSSAPARINTGLSLFTLALLVVPVMDAVYVKGAPRLYAAFDVTVAATVLCGVADALVQGGVIGFAGELPERYMQAVVAGTAASGVLVSAMRVVTKAIYPQDAHGLRQSAILYFIVGIVVMVICIVCYNVADMLPVVVYYKNIKRRAQKAEGGGMTGSAWRSTLWSIVGRVKWYGIGVVLIYAVTLSIFPGYITEDVHSEALNDWYPILLISAYNVFDLVGKSLPAIYLLQNANVAVAGSFARLLFFPLFYGCLHGPSFFRTEIPVTVLTCLLGLSNGYLTAVLMILAPKAVPIHHSETAGIVIVLFLVIGLVIGSFVAWFWVI